MVFLGRNSTFSITLLVTLRIRGHFLVSCGVHTPSTSPAAHTPCDQCHSSCWKLEAITGYVNRTKDQKVWVCVERSTESVPPPHLLLWVFQSCICAPGWDRESHILLVYSNGAVQPLGRERATQLFSLKCVGPLIYAQYLPVNRALVRLARGRQAGVAAGTCHFWAACIEAGGQQLSREERGGRERGTV